MPEYNDCEVCAEMSNNHTIMGDGTPVEDVLIHNRELQAQILELKRRMREIAHVCQSPTLYRSSLGRNSILEIARKP
jgi:hypothetical protein